MYGECSGMEQRYLNSPAFATMKLPTTCDMAGTLMLKFISAIVKVCGSPPGLTTVTWTD